MTRGCRAGLPDCALAVGAIRSSTTVDSNVTIAEDDEKGTRVIVCVLSDYCPLLRSPGQANKAGPPRHGVLIEVFIFPVQQVFTCNVQRNASA